MTNSYLAIINTFGETSVWPNLGQDFWSNLTPSHYVDARFDSFRAMRRSQIGSRMARSYSGILVFCTKIYRISYINVTEMITSKYDMTKLFFIICRFSDKLGYFLSATVNWRRRRLAFGDYESSPIAANDPLVKHSLPGKWVHRLGITCALPSPALHAVSPKRSLAHLLHDRASWAFVLRLDAPLKAGLVDSLECSWWVSLLYSRSALIS